MTGCPVPHYRRQIGFVPNSGDQPGRGLAVHGVVPAPPDPAPNWITYQMKIAPVPLELQGLHDLHPSFAPHAPGRSHQPHPHLIGPAHPLSSPQAGSGEGGTEPPFFHASCLARFAFSWTGRGIFGAHRNRPTRLYMPPSVYGTP